MFITKLPIDIIKESTKYLNKTEEHAFILSSRLFHSNCKFDYDASRLLQHVANGERSAARALLLNNPELALYKGRVIDKSGRVFNAITPLQYAIWALDKHMWEMLMSFMSEEHAARQFELLLNYGTEHGPHFDFTALINAYENYMNKFDAANEAEGNELWAKVGRAQQNIPAHVVHEYCNPKKSFYNIPTFQEPLSKCLSLFYHPELLDGCDWFSAKHFLEKQAVIRAWNGVALIVSAKDASSDSYGAKCGAAAIDFAAIKALFSIRMQEREALAETLHISTKNELKPV